VQVRQGVGDVAHKDFWRRGFDHGSSACAGGRDHPLRTLLRATLYVLAGTCVNGDRGLFERTWGTGGLERLPRVGR
jgi:hypothetical protein